MNLFKIIFSERSVTVIVVIGFLILLSGIIILFLGPGSNTGTFGDYVGGIAGSLWSLAGVGLFYLALKSQQDALEDQQKATRANVEALDVQKSELKLQREQLAATRDVFNEQSRTLKLQQFEATFFNLLHTYREVLANVQIWEVDLETRRFREPAVMVYGNDALFSLWMKFSFGITKHESITEEQVDSNYAQLIGAYRTYLEPYFMTVYHILKFIDNSTIDDKIVYAKLFRAQLTIHELRHIFYDSRLSVSGKLKALVEKYSMFQRLGPRDLVSEKHKEIFDPTAFNDNEYFLAV
jgi:hypothetical protein